MKNYEQLTKDLLERRDGYEAEKSVRRKKTARMTASLGCVCLVALVGFGLWRGIPGKDLPEETPEDATYIGVPDHFDESRGEAPAETIALHVIDPSQEPLAAHKIVVHSVDSVSSSKMNICLMLDDFVPMTYEEMAAYYGVEYVPAVPDDLKAVQTEQRGIFRREDGTGVVYWDEDHLFYENEEHTRAVSVAVDKGSYVLRDYWYFQGTEEKSEINDVEAVIGRTSDGCYYAEFRYRDVGFLICSEGLTETEFVAVVASVIR